MHHGGLQCLCACFSLLMLLLLLLLLRSGMLAPQPESAPGRELGAGKPDALWLVSKAQRLGGCC